MTQKCYGGEIISKLLKIGRCQIFYLLKTSQHLDEHYLQIDNLSYYKNRKGKIFITVTEKNINIITN